MKLIKSALFCNILSACLCIADIDPARLSKEFLADKRYDLREFATEQSHPKTLNLSDVLAKDTLAGLKMIASVDEDITLLLNAIANGKNNEQLLNLKQVVESIKGAIYSKNKIYICGFCSSGRLAKQLEVCAWRPLWKRILLDKAIYEKLKAKKIDIKAISDSLSGVLIGLTLNIPEAAGCIEDNPAVGEAQMKAYGIKSGDVVFSISASGESTCTIKCLQAAIDAELQDGVTPYKRLKAAMLGLKDDAIPYKCFYFVHNNPNDALLHIDRSREVVQNERVVTLELCTGPLAISGSTRMQPATIDTFVLGMILEQAAYEILQEAGISMEEIKRLGFTYSSLEERLRSFEDILKRVQGALPDLATITDKEYNTYKNGGFSHYFAGNMAMATLTDVAERSPTFGLSSLEQTNVPTRGCWVHLGTPTASASEAWKLVFGNKRDQVYHYLVFNEQTLPKHPKVLEEIRKLMLKPDEPVFDFSVKFYEKRPVKDGDFGLLVLTGDEVCGMQGGTYFDDFLRLFRNPQNVCSVIAVFNKNESVNSFNLKNIPSLILKLEADDPMNVRQQIALKLILNTHSTAVMGKMGRFIGNAMISVKPKTGKLISRATMLIQSQVNAHLTDKEITYEEANLALYETIMAQYAKFGGNKETLDETLFYNVCNGSVEGFKNVPLVPIAIVAVLQSLRQNATIRNISEAEEILEQMSLQEYYKRQSS